MSDIGLLSRRLGISINDYMSENDNLKTSKGAIAENDGNVVPVEVKVVTNTQAKSYKQFSKKYETKVGFKTSLKNIASNMINKTNTISIPLYLLWDIDYYVFPKK